MTAVLEHTNVTVSNPEATAQWMSDLFGWHVRWSGPAKGGGRSIHVGTDQQYLALYSPGAACTKADSYHTIGGLNHIAVTVTDLDAAEATVKSLGFEPHSHADYAPGRRFYFHDHDGIEFEIVQYD